MSLCYMYVLYKLIIKHWHIYSFPLKKKQDTITKFNDNKHGQYNSRVSEWLTD